MPTVVAKVQPCQVGITISEWLCFFSNKDFPFTQLLEDHWPAIVGEFQALPGRALMPFPEVHLYGEGWKLFSLYTFGEKLKHNCQFFPLTTILLEQIPELKMASFSRLAPSTHIKPHVGYHDSVLRCHLGLITSNHCALRVGGETRSWTQGECFVFDDTVEHEAWNRSDYDRVLLMIDFTKPGTCYSLAESFASWLGDILKASQPYRPGPR